MAEKPSFLKIDQRWISTAIVIGFTLVALFFGRLIKDTVESQTFPIERGGITVQVAKGWSVQNGIEGERTLFITSDPFDQTHRYTLSQLPLIPNGHLTDSVVVRNFERGQVLQNYQVLDQANIKVGSSDAYRVKYAYVETPKFSKLPVVMMGVDYYLPGKNRIVVVTMEENAQFFEQMYPAFIQFLNSMTLSAGG